MKGKFKGKILNLRNIIVSLIIVVMAVVSGISIVQYNSRNLQTNLDEDVAISGIRGTTTINTNWSKTASDFGITGAEIAAEALRLAQKEQNSSSYSGGCIQFVNTVVRNVATKNNGSASIPIASNWDSTTTIHGTSVDNALYCSRSEGFGDKKGIGWDEVVNSGTGNNTHITFQPGDVLIGNGHAMIVVGTTKPSVTLGKTVPGSDSTAQGQSYWKIYTDVNMVGNYWLADVNGNGNAIRISNYNWSDPKQSSQSYNLDGMKVYRFKKKDTPKKGTFRLKIKKVSRGANSKCLQAGFQIQGPGLDSNPTKVTTSTDGSDTIIQDKIELNDNVMEYQIFETTAPYGYSNEFWNYPLRIRVTRDNSKSDRYCIKKVEVAAYGLPYGSLFTAEADANSEGKSMILHVKNDGSFSFTTQDYPINPTEDRYIVDFHNGQNRRRN